MLYVTIIRHGETPSNVHGLIQGRTQGELTEKGVAMAQALGRYLEHEEFSHIFCSNLKRCVDTTWNILQNVKTKIPLIKYTPILQEKDYGDWEQLPGTLVLSKRAEMGLPPYKHHHVDAPKGETFSDCKKRAGVFVSELLDLLKIEEGSQEVRNVMVVSHGCFIACLLEYLKEEREKFELVNFTEEDMQRGPQNTSRTKLSIEKIKSACESNDDNYRIVFEVLFDAEHLKSLK